MQVTPMSDDPSALAWVVEEVHKSLEQAHKSLRKALKSAANAEFALNESVDLQALRASGEQLHKAIGALELAALPEGARVLRASEALVDKWVIKPHHLTEPGVKAIEALSFAVLDYIRRRIAGKPVSPMGLFPQYEAVTLACGADVARPADLWQPSQVASLDRIVWADASEDIVALEPQADALSQFETALLRLMREGDLLHAATLADLMASLAKGAAARSAAREANTWALASGFLEGLATSRLPMGIHAKRALSAVMGQLRATVRQQALPSERLAHDLMFYCAQAGGDAASAHGATVKAGLLDSLRLHFGLAASPVVDLTAPTLGLFDPAWVAQALKRVTAAKDGWSAVASGDMLRLGGLTELFLQLCDSLRRLYANGNALALALTDAAADTVQAGQPPSATLAMEVATSLLYVEASLQEEDFAHPQERERLQRLADRIEHVRTGGEPEPLDDWIEVLYRRVSDQQTMGSVVKELRLSLSECEKLIDQYFRDATQRMVLTDVPSRLKAMKGVFSVLGVPEASQAVTVMSADIDALLHQDQTDVLSHAKERLATNLSALGFLVDFLGVQPLAAKSLFVFQSDTGLLTSKVARSVPVSADAQPAAQPPAAVVTEAVVPTLPLVSAPVPENADAETDHEMVEVFVEEAREVLQESEGALILLASAPDDVNLLTTLRRSFHTLKGSSRMVGLTAFGEAAWACEQLYNSWLAAQSPASEDLQGLTQDALTHLSAAVELIATQANTQGWDAQTLIDAANALRLEGRRQAVEVQATVTTADDMSLEMISLDLSPEEAPLAPEASVLSAPLADFDVTGPAPFGDTGPAAFDFDNTSPAAFDVTGPAAFDALPPAAELPLPDITVDEEPLEQLELPEVTEDELMPDLPVELAQTPPIDQPPADLPEVQPVAEVVTASANDESVDEQYKIIGPLRISIPLFNIFLNEADEQSRRLSQSLGEWALQREQPVPEEAVNLAHSLAGNSAAVGYVDLSALARQLEHALMKSQALSAEGEEVSALFVEAGEEIRRLLHQFAAGFLRETPPELVARLHAYEQDAAQRLDAMRLDAGSLSEGLTPDLPTAPSDIAPSEIAQPEIAQPEVTTDVAATALMSLGVPEIKPFEALAADALTRGQATQQPQVDLGEDVDIDVIDAIDPDLFPVFEEEARELLPQLDHDIRAWLEQPEDRGHMDACMRTLHTFKGGARLAGAMRMGELAHRMEAGIERLAGQTQVDKGDIEPLLARADVLQALFDALVNQDVRAQQQPVAHALDIEAEQAQPLALRPQDDEPEMVAAPEPEPEAQPEPLPEPAAATSTAAAAPIDWSSVSALGFRPSAGLAQADAQQASGFASVRVKPRLLDRLVNQAGEMSIARSRLASQVQQMRGSVGDLTDNLERLRVQLRDIELQAETQLTTRMEAARAAHQDFDPLEFDRYTRFQELTRMMAESVNDVATVQRGLIRSLEQAEDHLVEQSRLTKELQDDLLRTRMVEFEGLSDRLYRVIRQAAKETGKQVRLDILGGQTEVDRGVLDRMTASFEHLLRNCVTHGIELPDARVAQGKPAMGAVLVSVQQEGNEVVIEFRDDGAGLNMDRIRSRAQELGLVQDAASTSEAELAQLIFTPGFSTATEVTELAGRGIGMDVVRADVTTMGGRIETATARGQGTSFKLMLPLTTAVTKVVMVRCGDLITSIPTNLVELVRRVPGDEVLQSYQSGAMGYGEQVLPFFWMGALLQHSPRGHTEGRSLPVLMIRSAQQRVALHVDEVLGNQDVVVKNLGPQLSRVPGLAGMTLQASGAIALIYNPVALAAVYGVEAQNWARDAAGAGMLAQTSVVRPEQALAPLVLVVDDSLTVRRVTQRLLVREGYRVTLAKDGMEALEKLAAEQPVIVLSDIEMPRMNGFDLVRNMRANVQWASLPVVMITSRIAQKHRDYAMELGVNHYLGKPYSEEELLSLVARYAAQAAQAPASFTTA